MNNNKQSYISKIRRSNRLLSYENCNQQLEKLSKKAIKSSFEEKQIQYYNNQILRLNIQAYMEGATNV